MSPIEGRRPLRTSLVKDERRSRFLGLGWIGSSKSSAPIVATCASLMPCPPLRLSRKPCSRTSPSFCSSTALSMSNEAAASSSMTSELRRARPVLRAQRVRRPALLVWINARSICTTRRTCHYPLSCAACEAQQRWRRLPAPPCRTRPFPSAGGRSRRRPS
jgi:hypothetical protein